MKHYSLWVMQCFSLSTLIHPHQRWPATGWSNMSLCPKPKPEKCLVYGVWDILFPQASLDLTAYCVHPIPKALYLDSQMGDQGDLWSGHVDALWAQQGSFPFIHIDWLHRLTTSETNQIDYHRNCMPRSFSNLMVEEATNPLHPPEQDTF